MDAMISLCKTSNGDCRGQRSRHPRQLIFASASARKRREV